jgi:ribosomal protein S18 acetylase RimI-like enzyme
MDIRPFAKEDTESVAELLRDMSVHYNGGNASTLEAVRGNLISNILGPNSGVRLMVASAGPQVVAIAAISLLYPAPKEKCQLFMKELYVHSQHRGSGIGEAMMIWLAKYAVEHECVRFDWTVDRSNPGAVRFYDELGAAHVADKLYYRFDGKSLEAFAARKPTRGA